MLDVISGVLIASNGVLDLTEPTQPAEKVSAECVPLPSTALRNVGFRLCVACIPGQTSLEIAIADLLLGAGVERADY